MFGMGMQELVIIGVIAVLLFGKRLPEVAKQLGQGYSQFKRGLTDVQKEFHSAVDPYSSPSQSRHSRADSYDDYDDRDEATAPKFEPPPAEPQVNDKVTG